VLLGHVDGQGTVVTRREDAGASVLGIRLDVAGLRSLLVPKGPIAVDGVSLTVQRLTRPSTIVVHLIPETLRQTTFGERRVGDGVNVEVDYLAKLWGRRAGGY